MTRLDRIRMRVAQWILGAPLQHPSDLAQFDRLYTDKMGRLHILDGSQGHSGAHGFHHGPRHGCIVCRDSGPRDTADLPRRFREVAG